MKPVTLLLCLSAASLHAEEPTPVQASEIMAGAHKLEEAFDKGDTETIIFLTHPKAHRLFGGEETFRKTTTGTIRDLKKKNVLILDNKYGKLFPLYRSGTDLVSFVPRTYVMHIAGRKIQCTGFLIAIQSEGQSWKFLDGAVLLQNPEILKILLPGLPEDAKVPENRYVPIE